jgi:hypothetical protein
MNYYDYLKNNTDDCIYVVTWYGCNSTPSDLITPDSFLFKNFNDAYEQFLNSSPHLNNKDNYAEQYIPTFDSSKINEKYVVIETRVQTVGYHYYDSTDGKSYAKRPYGAALARCLFN